MMENNNFTLELGYGLISLVDNNDPVLLDGITNLRKLKPQIPRIHIMDNMTLEPFQICLNGEKYNLRNNDDYVSEVLNIILLFVEKQPESQVWSKTFTIGESLSFDIEDQNKRKFRINLMLPGYPSLWNSTQNDEINSNCTSAYYITEISEISKELYNFEIINTKVDIKDKDYNILGRFKFVLKKGDLLNFQYYEDSKNSVNAIVRTIDNNVIDLQFDKAICVPESSL